MPRGITSSLSGIRMPRDLRPREVAEMLGCGVAHVDKLCERGVLKGYKMSNGPKGRWRIPEAEVQSYREKQMKRIQANRPESLVAAMDQILGKRRNSKKVGIQQVESRQMASAAANTSSLSTIAKLRDMI